MSQYDFGVIDPQVRDGTWLADALNQWRDALYSMHSGAAAPAYAVDGLIWRDISGGAALTTMRQRDAAAWHDLWSIDDQGKVRFTGTVANDGGDITGTLHLTGNPSLFADYAVGIGPGFDVTPPAQLLHVRAPDVTVMIEGTGDSATGQATRLRMKMPDHDYELVNNAGRFYLWDYTRNGVGWSVGPGGSMGIGIFAPQYKLHVYDPAVGVSIAAHTAGAGQARLDLVNSARSWAIFTESGNLNFYDLNRGPAGTFDTNGLFSAYNALRAFAGLDPYFALTRSGDIRYFQFYHGTHLQWNGANGYLHIYNNNAEAIAMVPGGGFFFNGIGYMSIDEQSLTGGRPFTMATRPSPASRTGKCIWVTDGGLAILQWSNGSGWIYDSSVSWLPA